MWKTRLTSRSAMLLNPPMSTSAAATARRRRTQKFTFRCSVFFTYAACFSALNGESVMTWHLFVNEPKPSACFAAPLPLMRIVAKTRNFACIRTTVFESSSSSICRWSIADSSR